MGNRRSNVNQSQLERSGWGKVCGDRCKVQGKDETDYGVKGS